MNGKYFMLLVFEEYFGRKSIHTNKTIMIESLTKN